MAEEKEDFGVIARAAIRAGWVAVDIEMCLCVGEWWWIGGVRGWRGRGSSW
jgi:hypothetical protein